jgi:GTP-binding protein Era
MKKANFAEPRGDDDVPLRGNQTGAEPTSPEAPMRAGFVALIGRPNVGKSTLLNHILEEKLAIVSPKPQTTRTRLLGIKNLPRAQLALVDTPGMHRPDGRGRTMLNRYMVDEALAALGSVDVVLVMTDLDPQRIDKAAPRREGAGDEPADTVDPAVRAVRALLHPADRYVVDQLDRSGKPVVLAINKVDLLKDKSLLLPLIAEWSASGKFRAIVPISAERGDGIERLLAELVAAVPAGEALFPPDMLTDRAERHLVAELVREQVFLAVHQELPYAVAVTIDSWEERLADAAPRAGERIGVVINATVHVEKANQKKIIVGEGGRMIRDIGTAARQAIGALLGCGVHLALFVRVDEGWTTSAAGLRKMGYEPELAGGESRGTRAPKRPPAPRRRPVAQPPARGRHPAPGPSHGVHAK